MEFPNIPRKIDVIARRTNFGPIESNRWRTLAAVPQPTLLRLIEFAGVRTINYAQFLRDPN